MCSKGGLSTMLNRIPMQQEMQLHFRTLTHMRPYYHRGYSPRDDALNINTLPRIPHACGTLGCLPCIVHSIATVPYKTSWVRAAIVLSFSSVLLSFISHYCFFFANYLSLLIIRQLQTIFYHLFPLFHVFNHPLSVVTRH